MIRDPHILPGLNFSALEGTSTDDPMLIMRAAEEVAVVDKCPLYVFLNDVQKCFDSVGAQALVLALRRIKIGEDYIKLVLRLHQQRVVAVVTAYGPSPPFRLGSIVQQGSSQAPLHWRIVWDIVLTLIQSHSKGFTFSYNNPPSIPAEYVEQCDPVSVSSTAFVDDTTLMSDSHEDISLQAKYC